MVLSEETSLSQNSFLIIDSHAHVTENGHWFSSGVDASVEALLKQMDSIKAGKAILLPIFRRTTNRFMAKIRDQHPERFFAFGSANLSTWREDLKEILDLGLQGVKFHPRLHGHPIGHFSNTGFFEELTKSKIPLLVCGWTQSKTVDIIELSPMVIDKLAKQYPKIPFIISHMGGHFFWDAIFCARSNDNVYLDCSYFLEFFKGTSLEQDFWHILEKTDQKVLFGSDFPEISLEVYFQKFKRNLKKLNVEKQKSILHGNILRVLGTP